MRAGPWKRIADGLPIEYRLCDVAICRTGVKGTDDTEPCWRLKRGVWHDNEGRPMQPEMTITHWRYSAHPSHPEVS